METLEQKKRRLFGRFLLPDYLKELNNLVKYKITALDLLSIEESDKILEASKKLEKRFFHKCTFGDKKELHSIISNIGTKDKNPYYLYTEYSNDCGMAKINTINDFNVNFSFYDEHSGLIILINENTTNKILLDFYKEEEDIFTEIEVYTNY